MQKGRSSMKTEGDQQEKITVAEMKMGWKEEKKICSYCGDLYDIYIYDILIILNKKEIMIGAQMLYMGIWAPVL